ncbi:MAG: hypothetical protein K5930_10700, partial [Treponemataceae bacterium]|nr:hypothetical protein [Treponemataceae bacterium]
MNLISSKHVGFSKLVSEDAFYKQAQEAVFRLDASFNAGEGDQSRLTALYYELCGLAAMLHDGHTGIEMPETILPSLEFYPFATTEIGGKLVIVSVSKEYASCLGRSILELNGIPFEEVVKAIKGYISYDTEAYALKKVSDSLNIRQLLDYSGIGA